MPGVMLLARGSIALVWLYNGAWCKLLGGSPRHVAVVDSVPLLPGLTADTVLFGIGLLEIVLAVWVLAGRWMRSAAVAQILLLLGMNAMGLLWARAEIPDPAGMVVQNVSFLVLVWLVGFGKGVGR
jgi:uncharacterized membrane protein YphA (DoxX/SURF4 family)